MSNVAERTASENPVTAGRPNAADGRSAPAPLRDLEIVAPPNPTVVVERPVEVAGEAVAAKQGLARRGTATLIALAIVLLVVASAVLSKYPDLRGDISIASKVLGYPATDLPVLVHGHQILDARTRLATKPDVYQFGQRIQRVPWTIETDIVSPFTEVRFDRIDDRNFCGVRQVPKYSAWEVFRRTDGVDARLGWITAGPHDDRPLVIVRSATTFTVMLGNDVAAGASLPAPVTPSTIEVISTQSCPPFTYFDVRQAR